MSLVKRRNVLVVIIAGLAALVATGGAYAEGVFDDAGAGPPISASAQATPVPEYPGWSYAAAASETGTPCIVLVTPLGKGRWCALSNSNVGMLNAGFVTDEATGKRYGFVVGFTQPSDQTRASFSDGTARVNTSTGEGAYFVAVTPDDIENGVLPIGVADSAGTSLASDLPREVFEAGNAQS